MSERNGSSLLNLLNRCILKHLDILPSMTKGRGEAGERLVLKTSDRG